MHAILKFFASLRTAVILISLIAIIAMVGTLIPQMREAGEYLGQFPKMGHWILALGFDDVYHGVIFQILLWLLSISTLVCTLLRVRLTRKKMFHRIEYASAAEIKAMRVNARLASFDENLVDSYFSTSIEKDNDYKINLHTSGKASLVGGLLIHIGFLILLAGGFVGVSHSSEMTISGRAGDTVPVPPIEAINAAMNSDRLAREGRNIREFSPNDPELNIIRDEVNKLRDEYLKGQVNPAFKLKFAKLWVDYYKDKTSGARKGIKGWNTNIEVIKNGAVVATATLSVNNPFTFDGITFYQANWSQIFRKVKLRIDFIKNIPGWKEVKDPSIFPCEVEFTVGEPFKPAWASASFLLKEFMPDFRIMNNRFVSISNELNNPAGQIFALNSEGKEIGRAWAFSKKIPMVSEHISNMPFNFTFISAEPEFESGLQVAHDPGKPFVWLGCVIFTIGMFLTFYITYYEEWFVVTASGDFFVAVNSNEPRDMLEERMQNLIKKIQTKE